MVSTRQAVVESPLLSTSRRVSRYPREQGRDQVTSSSRRLRSARSRDDNKSPCPLPKTPPPSRRESSEHCTETPVTLEVTNPGAVRVVERNDCTILHKQKPRAGFRDSSNPDLDSHRQSDTSGILEYYTRQASPTGCLPVISQVTLLENADTAGLLDSCLPIELFLNQHDDATGELSQKSQTQQAVHHQQPDRPRRNHHPRLSLFPHVPESSSDQVVRGIVKCIDQKPPLPDEDSVRSTPGARVRQDSVICLTAFRPQIPHKPTPLKLMSFSTPTGSIRSGETLIGSLSDTACDSTSPLSFSHRTSYSMTQPTSFFDDDDEESTLMERRLTSLKSSLRRSVDSVFRSAASAKKPKMKRGFFSSFRSIALCGCGSRRS